MNNRYVIKDWTSASKIINSRDIDLAINTTVDLIPSVEDPSKEVVGGYQVAVYSKSTRVVKALVPVEQANGWCITTDECIDFLNSLGFICKFDKSELKASKYVVDILKSLKELGYQFITREVRPSLIKVFKDNDETAQYLNCRFKMIPCHFVTELRRIVSYDYKDFFFLNADQMYLIDEIIKDNELGGE